jgi:hypothetical protein
MLRLLAACFSAASIILPAAQADETAPSEPEGVYICLQNAAMTGSIWHPVECKRLADVEDEIADRAGQPVVRADHIEPPNAVGSTNIWWKVDFRGVGKAPDKTAHWFCSDHGGGFSCVWQSTNNQEDWAAYNQFRDYGMADIPTVFWVPKELVGIYRDSKPLMERRAANEARYAKAEALAKSSAFQWAYISYEGGACRPLGPTTPFKFMQSVSAKRHHSIVDWDAPVADEDVSRSTVGTSNDPTVPLKDGPVREYSFFVSAEACNAMLASSLPNEGIKVSDGELAHKPAVKWLITDDTESPVACHWPNAATGKSPKEFLAILTQQGAKISEVSKSEVSTTDNRISFEISFSYTLKGHANQISWSDLGDFGCDPRAKDQLQLP